MALSSRALSSRRQFLEASMWASAGAFAISQTARSSEAAQPQDATSPNEQVSVAVVGVNSRGNNHIEGLAGRNGAIVTYICDCDSKIGEKRCDEVATRQNGKRPKFVRDIRQVLEDDSVDAITIAMPNHWHALGAIWGVQAGKHVYVEKPVSHNVSEGRRIVEAARKYNKLVQTGTQSRSNPGMRDAMAFIHGGGIGEVKLARGLCYKRRGSIGAPGTYSVPKEVDYNLWQGPAAEALVTRPQFHYDWHWQYAYGNGDLGNQGIHQMDLCRWALGQNKLSRRVLSYGGRFGYRDAGETANTQVVIHDYEGQQLIFEVRGLKTGDYRGANVGIIVEGSEGYVVMTSYHSGKAFDKEGKEIKSFSVGNDDYHYANFIAAVRSGNSKDLNADIEEGHLSSALCHLANASLRLGQQVSAAEMPERLFKHAKADEVKDTYERTLAHLKENELPVDAISFQLGPVLEIDQAQESFIGNAAANAMLTREYREPFVVPAAGKV